MTGRVHAIRNLAADMVKVVISTDEQLEILPGQHVQVCISGFPSRVYSPTVPLKEPVDNRKICFHVRRVANGRVSSALGAAIGPGRKASISRPEGSAFLRPGLSNRLVLVSSGAGFASVWSIAHAALRENAEREIVVIAEAKHRGDLYLANALVRLAACPNVRVHPVIRAADKPQSAFWINNPLVFMPRLSPDDIVHAFGAPLLVEGVASVARTAGALCYAEPFVAAELEATP
ncbi:FAD-binding oxidoreductase [Rhodoblastus acidophilus]|uniref:FAD-binding oxidoreductase n=1 Tax=Rhodoblastus acidophilus TaxID=1074 RepID=UPI000D4E6EE4|nr:FAD-binding oxidoreductase [Rhodoblastus acidophilus]PPQ37209.1 hypothetical protein CKO16_14735 [Rhodoblastus acidophilus]